ncbi:MAG TPA: TonB-dependent receptor [Gammaproteobacteria bacterium]|nr:TonB-dependent receptor [Gammaproteobacteria bacterium]
MRRPSGRIGTAGRRGWQKYLLIVICAGFAANVPAAPPGVAHQPAAPQTVRFNIPSQPLQGALLAFSDQASVQVASPAAIVAERSSPGVTGTMSVPAGLTRLLADTGFEYVQVAESTYAVRPARTASGPDAAAMAPPATAAEPADDPPADQPAVDADQADEASASDQAQAFGTVMVTGSRIGRTDIVGSQPVLRISRQQIETSGLTSIGQILETITSAHPTQNAAFNFEADGSSSIDLRFLGSKRVLVLVNGQRWITGLSGATDLNTIPLSLVDHIEVLQNGASALYGSDAVAGVVNVILKKHFKGAQASAFIGAYRGGGDYADGWDGKTEHYSVTLGQQGDDEGFTFNASYRSTERIAASNRGFSHVPVYGTGVTRGSSATPQGRFSFVAPTLGNPSSPNVAPAPFTGLTAQQCPARNFGTADNPEYLPYCDLTLKPGANGQNPANYVRWSNAARYNWIKASGNSLGDSLVIPIEMKSIYTRAFYDLTPNVTFHISGFYNARHSQTDAAPTPLFFDNGTIGANQKYNPFGFTLSSVNPVEVAPGVERPSMSFLYRRLSEFPIRQERRRVHTYRFGGGFNGMFTSGTRLWSWDTAFIYMSNSLHYSNPAGIDATHFDNALSSDCSAHPDCVPLNLFGGQGTAGNGTISPAQVNYIAYTQQSHTRKVERIYDANISTPNLATLPAGNLGFAAGYEYRQEIGKYLPDSHSQLGETLARQAVKPTSGRYKVDSVYAEFKVPLLTHLPAAYQLNLDIASRYSNYTTFGSTVNSRVGFKYRPVKDLAIRGTWSQAYRAPNIHELYASQALSYPTVFDPCSDYKTSNVSAAVAKRCAAAGVPASYSQADQQVDTLVGGNPNLQPETATTKSVGFVYSPHWLPGFNISADYYHIELDNTIQPFGAQNVVNACYKAGNTDQCAKIDRSQFGKIARVINTETNIGGTFTDGIDVGVSYAFPTPVGHFRVSVDETHVRDYEIYFPNGEGGTTTTELVGIERAGFIAPFSVPSDKANLGITWSSGPWRASFTLHYISDLWEPHCSDARDGTKISLTALGLCSDPNYDNNYLSRNHLGSVVWDDVRAQYEFRPINTTLAFGIRNLFNKKPPHQARPIEDIAFDPTEYQFLIGRFFYLSATVRFD